MAVVEKYINKALGDLPNRRINLERPGLFMKGEVRNDDNPNDAFATKVLPQTIKKNKV